MFYEFLLLVFCFPKDSFTFERNQLSKLITKSYHIIRRAALTEPNILFNDMCLDLHIYLQMYVYIPPCLSVCVCIALSSLQPEIVRISNANATNNSDKNNINNRMEKEKISPKYPNELILIT